MAGPFLGEFDFDLSAGIADIGIGGLAVLQEPLGDGLDFLGG